MDTQSAFPTMFLTNLQIYFEHFRGIPEPSGVRHPSMIGSNFRKALKASRLSIDGNYTLIQRLIEKDRDYATRMVTEFTVNDQTPGFRNFGVNYFRTLYFLCKALQHYVDGRQSEAERSIELIFTNLRNARMLADTG